MKAKIRKNRAASASEKEQRQKAEEEDNRGEKEVK